MEKIFERVHKAKTLQHHIRYHPAAHFTIEKAEYLFGMSFCGDYQDFLKKFGFLQINQRRIQGLSQKTPSIYDEDSFLWATRKFREQYIHDPHLSVLENCNDQWYFLLNHANGKLYGF
ncbi:MAG: SMI1/KNR4 family protein, partial [Pseudomonadota bacterium]